MRCLRSWIALASVLVVSLAAVAQGPAVANSVLLDQNTQGVIGLDPAGVAYLGFFSPPMKKFNADGTLAGTIPLLASAAQIGFDAAGNLYVLQPTCGSACPAPTGSYGLASGSGAITFGRVSSTGNVFLWLFAINGGVPGSATMQVDAAGDVYVTGAVACSSIPAGTSGSYQSQCASGSSNAQAAFAAKVDSTGILVFFTFLHGTTTNSGAVKGTSIDSSGNMYLVGTAAADWPTTPGAFEAAGSQNFGFAAKLSADGAHLLYSTFLNEGVPSAVAVDGQGNAYIAGQTTSTAFPTTPGSAQPAFSPWTSSPGNAYPAFVLKLKRDGSGRVYSTYAALFDNTVFNPSQPPGIFLDSNNNAYLFASTRRPGYSTVNAIQSIDNAQDPTTGQGAIAELNAAGSAFTFSSYLGGAIGGDSVTFAVLGSDGLLHLAGFTSATSFPALSSAATLFGAARTPFVMALQPSATAAVPIMFTADPVSANSSPQTGALSSVLPAACVTAPCTSTGTAISGTSQGIEYLGNYGPASLTIGSITATGTEFTQTNNCPTSLAPGARCAINVTFKPTGLGTRTGTLTLTTGSQTQTFQLSGSGIAPQAQPNPSSLQFGALATGTSSTPQSVAVLNSGTSDLIVTGIATQGDFSQTNNCTTAVRPGSWCTVQVTFTPTVSGPETGTLTISSNAVGSPSSVALAGGANPDFTLGTPTGGTTTQTVTAGQTATFNLTITPFAGFNGTVTFSCTGAPTNATCTNPTSLNVSGTAATAFNVTVSTTARAAAQPAVAARIGSAPGPWFWPVSLSAALGSICFGSRRRRMLAVLRPLCVLALAALLFATGCSGSSSSTSTTTTGTTAGTYTLTLTATSGSISHTQSLTLTVN